MARRKSGNAATLRRYWTSGKGAAKIRWGQGGDFNRCVKYLRKYLRDPQGYCAVRHKAATGMWTSTHARRYRARHR